MIIPNGYTPMATKAVVQAQLSAAGMGLSTVGTGHLLIGLAKADPDVAKGILGELDIPKLESAVLSCYGRGDVGYARITAISGHLQRVFLRASAYISSDRRKATGTVQLWLELLYEEGCHAHEILHSLGKEVESMKATLSGLFGTIERPKEAEQIAASENAPAPEEVEAVRKKNTAGDSSPSNALSQYARNLTQEAREMRLEPMIGREKEIDAIIQVLGKKTKNNPLLIGEPGVGKTAVVEGLAQKIIMNQVPPAMKDLKIYALDMARLVAGTKFRGDFEDRMTRLVDALQKDPNAILFIDEIHMVVGGGRADGSMDAGNMLKPALARGNVRVIGSTTRAEYRKYFEKDMALARRFQRIDIDEPSRAQALAILEGIRDRYEEFHHVTITDEALTAAVDYSTRYITDRKLPDKAIDLLDETASRCKLGIGQMGESVENTAKLLAAIQQGNEELRNELIRKRAQEKGGPIIRDTDVAQVVSTWTGIPAEQILFRGNENLLTLEDRMNRHVIGQKEAIHQVCASLRRSASGLGDPDRPAGVFLLLGSSGVGKTELCRALAEHYFGSRDALIRLDMSEYSEEISITSLIGSPPGYVGYGDGAKLTDSVLNRPYSVVLFDEIEKAHPKVYNLLLQLLDNGELTDSVGHKVNFRNTIVMMTSNAGVTFDMDRQMGFGEASRGDLKRQLMNRVKNVFRPEFLGRIDDIIVMNQLTEEDGARIAGNMLEQLSQRLAARGYRLDYADDVLKILARHGMSKDSGARNIRRQIQEEISDPLSLRLLQEPDLRHIVLLAENEQIRIELLPLTEMLAPGTEELSTNEQLHQNEMALHSEGFSE